MTHLINQEAGAPDERWPSRSPGHHLAFLGCAGLRQGLCVLTRLQAPCELRGGWSLLRPEPLQWGSRTLREFWAGGKRGWFPRPIGMTAASLPKWISPSSEPNSVWYWVKGQAGVMSLGPIDETQEVTLLTQDTGRNRVEAFCPVGGTDHCSPLQLRPLWPLQLKARRSG